MPRFLGYKISGSRAFVPRIKDDFVQHPEVEGLKYEEYDEYIADPFRCTLLQCSSFTLNWRLPTGRQSELFKNHDCDKQVKASIWPDVEVEKNMALLLSGVGPSKHLLIL